MQTLRKRLEEYAKKTSSRLDVVQQDYLLTWLLASISKHPLLTETLVFKGGTALKKCYFGEYRFSEDLDFTANILAPRGAALETAIQRICADAEAGMHVYGSLQLVCKRYREKSPHPHDQEAFTVRAQFPWQREPLTQVMIEISYAETLILPPCRQKLLHSYEEGLAASITTYSLDEIILEKLRAVLQQTKKLHERSWSRSRARDYYDLWYILCHTHYVPELTQPTELLEKKCSPKGVRFSSPEDFFSPIMVADVRKTWEHWVGSLVSTLPNIDKVVTELKNAIETLLSPTSHPMTR